MTERQRIPRDEAVTLFHGEGALDSFWGENKQCVPIPSTQLHLCRLSVLFWKLVKHKRVWDYIGKYPTSFCLPLHLVLLTLARKLSLMPWTSVSFSSKSLLVPSVQVLFMLSLLLFLLFYHTQVHTQKYSCTKCSDCMILLTVAILLPQKLSRTQKGEPLPAKHIWMFWEHKLIG